ncbi:unnamed protein product [Ilex paraguariensis]|uniref:Fe2OG dioxygenase domain-containing protein n=1 Tax=Ilex paraguariensis TaxID=185542 RepID=A0ABC8SMS7_9AQUA
MPSSKAVNDKTLPSVQELAKEPLIAIPRHYVQAHQEPTALSDSFSLPIVDMKNLIIGEAKDLELENLHSICKTLGIFQVVNHGVSSLLVEKLKHDIEEFYKLPVEEKFKVKPGDVEGYGSTMIQSEHQKANWGDRFYMITNPLHRRKPHLLPELPISLRDTIESYLSELQKLAMTIFGLMAVALKIDKREIEEMFEDGMQAVRMNYYPPCPQSELVTGFNPHSDATGITILLEINGVEGFQIKKDGVWFPIKFLPDAFVVNVGDVFEIFSNGIYNSIEHRAVVNAVKERISIAMFFNPKFEAKVGPANNLINPHNPPLFRTVTMENYFKDFFSRKLDGKSYLEHMKLQNSEIYTN